MTDTLNVPRVVIDGMSALERDLIKCFNPHSEWGMFTYLFFYGFEDGLEGAYPNEVMKAGVRLLAAKGVLEFKRGLRNEEGGVAGSGYGLTDLGRQIYAMLAAAPKDEPAWSETYIADEEDGPISGVLIDMLDGVQIWTGEASKALVDAAIAIDESPDLSGIYLMTGCPQQGTRIMASLARVEDGTEIARALAMKWSEASQPEAPKVEQEPVAWMYRDADSKTWTVGKEKKWGDYAVADGGECKPLYPHPATSSELPTTEELRDLVTDEQVRFLVSAMDVAQGRARLRDILAAIAKHKGPQS